MMLISDNLLPEINWPLHVIKGRFSEKQNEHWVHLGQSFLSIYFPV